MDRPDSPAGSGSPAKSIRCGPKFREAEGAFAVAPPKGGKAPGSRRRAALSRAPSRAREGGVTDRPVEGAAIMENAPEIWKRLFGETGRAELPRAGDLAILPMPKGGDGGAMRFYAGPRGRRRRPWALRQPRKGGETRLRSGQEV
jgi:hypothetical protein